MRHNSFFYSIDVLQQYIATVTFGFTKLYLSCFVKYFTAALEKRVSLEKIRLLFPLQKN
jgi:CMP-2-keto-3-deoxyoctulosonic acid synthetase